MSAAGNATEKKKNATASLDHRKCVYIDGWLVDNHVNAWVMIWTFDNILGETRRTDAQTRRWQAKANFFRKEELEAEI